MVFYDLTAVPDKPKNFTVISKSWESVATSWLPSFDGGYAQEFHVTVSALFRNSTLVYSAGTENTFNITGITLKSVSYFFVNNLRLNNTVVVERTRWGHLVSFIFI